jgi:hypothetical protein
MPVSPFPPAQLGNTVFASQTIEYDTDLLLRTVLFACLTLDVSNGLF